LALEVAEYFRLNEKKAKAIINQIKKSVRNWRAVSSGYSISREEQDFMSSAFTKAY